MTSEGYGHFWALLFQWFQNLPLDLVTLIPGSADWE